MLPCLGKLHVSKLISFRMKGVGYLEQSGSWFSFSSLFSSSSSSSFVCVICLFFGFFCVFFVVSLVC